MIGQLQVIGHGAQEINVICQSISTFPEITLAFSVAQFLQYLSTIPQGECWFYCLSMNWFWGKNPTQKTLPENSYTPGCLATHSSIISMQLSQYNSFGYNLFPNKIWLLQKGFVDHSTIMELIYFHMRHAAEAQTLYCHRFRE